MSNTFWWRRKDLAYNNGSLHLGDEDLEALVRAMGTPSFVYNLPRVLEKLDSLHQALENQQLPHTIFYALKANRHPALLNSLRLHNACGIDVCSPNELRLARQAGFAENEITYTGTSVANMDLDLLARMPDVHINCDSLSSLRRLGERAPGRTIGLRVNPEFSASHLKHISYAGKQATKFGIYPDQLDEAMAIAERYKLHVNTIHFHAASGYLNEELPLLQNLLERVVPFLERLPTVTNLDIGGGLGVPLTEKQQPLNLNDWAKLLADFALPRGLHLQLEPGDYLVKDAGVLLVQVNTVEEKGGTLFVGVDAGFNLSNLHAYYQYPYIIAPLSERPGAATRPMTIAGNINEGIDTLAEDVELPVPEEGDYLAIMNLGGYSTSSSSNHCMRGEFQEFVLN
ncbi:MAG: diaminopimelate decarboxylase [Halioglobus sp.]